MDDHNLFEICTLLHRMQHELCDRCRNFDIHAFGKTPSRTKGYLLRDVQTWADSSCAFCALLARSIHGINTPEYFYASAIPWWLRMTKPDIYVHMTVSKNYETPPLELDSHKLNANRLLVRLGDRFSDVKAESEFEICLAADVDSPAASEQMISGRYPGSEPGSQSYLDAINGWIDRCTRHHPKCMQTASGSPLPERGVSDMPMRCIEISENGKKLYLRDTSKLKSTYITLTHRWNSETHMSRTTTANYDQRLNGEGFGRLPQLFLDSFTIAKKLGVRYVWIDSLCIIQEGDNKRDWKEQAPLMAEYYQNSLLTIAGTMSEMEGGILKPYKEEDCPWDLSLVRLPYRNESGQLSGYFYVYKRRSKLVDDYWNLVRESTVFKRAWILQEWLLSKRILWYTSNGLFLECHSESPHTPCQEQISLSVAQPNLRDHLMLKNAFHFSNPTILQFWYHAVEVYSSFDITYTSDWILAIEGLAKEISKILGRSQSAELSQPSLPQAVYLSGLWLADIHRGLLWQMDPEAAPWTRTVEKAPTWSWSSLVTPVKWPNAPADVKHEMIITGVCPDEGLIAHSDPEYRLIEETLIPQVPTGTFGSSNLSACLHITGRLRNVHIHGYLAKAERLKIAASATMYEPAPTAGRWRAICSTTRNEVICGWASLERELPDEGECADFGTSVLALLVSTRYCRTGLLLKRSEPIIDVLFLAQQTGRDHVYQRIGVGSIFDGTMIRDFHRSTAQEIQLV